MPDNKKRKKSIGSGKRRTRPTVSVKGEDGKKRRVVRSKQRRKEALSS